MNKIYRLFIISVSSCLLVIAIFFTAMPGLLTAGSGLSTAALAAIQDEAGEQKSKRLIPPRPAEPAPADNKPKPAEQPVVGEKLAPPKVEQPIDDSETPTSRPAMQAATVPSKTTGLELIPDKIEISSTKRFQIVTARTAGKVKWLVFNKGKDPVEWLPLPGTKSIQIFPNYGVDDEITVYAYTVVGGEPTDPVKSTVVVGKKTEQRPPSGEVENPGDHKPPKTDDKPSGLHFTIITDEDLPKANPILANLISNKDLRAGVENRGHKFWVMDQKKDIAKIKERGFDEHLRKIGKVPLYILQDQAGAVIDSGPLPTTLVAILKKLDAAEPRP